MHSIAQYQKSCLTPTCSCLALLLFYFPQLSSSAIADVQMICHRLHTGLVVMATCDVMDWVPGLPSEVLSSITVHLTAGDISKSSTVNSAWKEAFGRTVQRLTPQGALQRPVCLAQRFPELQVLAMDECEGVNVTDEQVVEAARLRYLKRLSLAGCRACTDESVAGLAVIAGRHMACELTRFKVPSQFHLA